MTKEEYQTVISKFKVKIKSLSVESLIIKKEEKKAKYLSTKTCLYRHRIDIVRREQRYTLLAYAYFRGKTYQSIEKTKNKPSIKTINRILKSLTGNSSDSLESWLS